MKTSQWAAVSAAAFAMCTLVSTTSLAVKPVTKIPATPVGVLTAFPTIVQTGTKPTLNWNILYPSKVSDLVVINPPGTLVPTDQVYVTVQIVGTDPSGCDPTMGSEPLPSEVRMSVNGGSYEQLFYGVQADVDPSHILYTKKHSANDTINFGGRYVKSGVWSWSPFYTTRNPNFQVIALTDGDIPPTMTSLYDSPTLAEYLKPYLDSSGKVDIGPLSILMLMELGETDRNQACFDYQDQVLLVTLSKKHPNNGHGNNLDGVDVSNPGEGSGGPNGEIDPSGDFDDEIK